MAVAGVLFLVTLLRAVYMIGSQDAEGKTEDRSAAVYVLPDPPADIWRGIALQKD